MLFGFVKKRTKMKTLYLFFILAFVNALPAQNLGQIAIHNSNSSNPDFIVSLNGVRQNNQYSPTTRFDFLDEYNYHVKILLSGSSSALSFNIANTPNYLSVYVLNKDVYGNYALILESKTLIGNQPPPLTNTVIVVPPTSVNQSNMINQEEYQSICQTIKNESFESSKLEMAKTIFGTREASSVQVLGVMKLFSTESTKLEFAKFAYYKTYDRKNYYKVYEAFNFSSSKKELSIYIKANP